MTVYAPKHQPWHDTLPGNEHGCVCDPAWKDRGIVSRGCYYHEMIEAVEDLRSAGWLVVKVDGPVFQLSSEYQYESVWKVLRPLIEDGVLVEIGDTG
jgi:hypothetical protein